MKEKIFNPFEFGLPCDLPTERLVIANAIADSQRFSELRDILSPNDFSSDQHAMIWNALCEMHDKGQKIDCIMLASYLQAQKLLESVGGVSALVELDRGMPQLPNLDSWVETIKKKSVKRKAIIECNRYMLRLAESNEDASEVFEEASARMSELNGELAGDIGFSTPADIIRECGGINNYLDNRRNSGIQTPWSRLNRFTGGLRPNELIVIAAHTARGKTAFALNLAHWTASRHSIPVAIFSMEMEKALINDRFVAINGKFDGRTLRRMELDPFAESERKRVVRESVQYVSELPLYICDSTTSTVPAIEGKLRRLMNRVPIGMVIVDYLQLMSGVGKPTTRAEEVGAITRSLKRLSSILKIPVIALSQFNRDSARDNREPEKYDLRESGTIEQDANLILAIHFTRMYDVLAGIPTGDVKLKILKQRNGPEGFINFTFHAPSGVFAETEDREYAGN